MFDVLANAYSCTNPYYSAVLGATTAVTGFDRLFPVPPGIHWALAGAGGHYYCTRQTDSNMAMGAFYGWAGGFGASALLSMLS